MSIYQVTTELRTYNAVDSVYTFIHRIRPNWEDFTAVLSVLEWVDCRWVKIDPKEWVENNP